MNDSQQHIIEKKQNIKNVGGLQHYFDIIDKIEIILDKLMGEVTTYRGEQTLNSATLSNHSDRIEKIEKHLNFPATI